MLSCLDRIRSAQDLMLAGTKPSGDAVLWEKYKHAYECKDSCGPEHSRDECVADSQMVRDWVKYWGVRADEMPVGARF